MTDYTKRITFRRPKEEHLTAVWIGTALLGKGSKVYAMYIGDSFIGIVRKDGRVWTARLDGEIVAGGASRTYVADCLLARYDERGGR